jgi:hypothetical protein
LDAAPAGYATGDRQGRFDVPGRKSPGPSVKDERRYEALRREGASKEKAARIANSPAGKTGRKGGKASNYEDQTKEQLQRKARQVGIEGRSKMSKGELINALRNH